MKIKTLGIILLVLLLAGMLWAGEKQGVYEYVLQPADGNLEEVQQKLLAAVDSSEYQMLGWLEETSPEGCAYRARVFLLLNTEWANALLKLNPETAPFGVVSRITVFEDERGVNVSILNPENVLRTIFLDDERVMALAAAEKQRLRELITGSLQGKIVEQQYGQFRKKGYIGRTMGVMAGGPFNEKMKTVITLESDDLSATLNRLVKAFEQPGADWQLKPVFHTVLGSGDVAILGVSSPKMESKSFDIVKAGSDDSRKDFKCPGIAHAAAYPIEIVLKKEQGKIQVQIVETMYRMKMFFEDAGKWAFAKNMGMPGSIQAEIERQIEKLAAQ